jgi:hypothetical protein
MKTLSGEVKLCLIQAKVQISNDDEEYTEGIKNYLNINENLIKRLNVSHKNLFMEMNAVSVRMKEISEIYEQLSTVSYKTNDVNLTY